MVPPCLSKYCVAGGNSLRGDEKKKGECLLFLIDRLALIWSIRLCKKSIMDGFKSGPGRNYP